MSREHSRSPLPQPPQTSRSECPGFLPPHCKQVAFTSRNFSLSRSVWIVSLTIATLLDCWEVAPLMLVERYWGFDFGVVCEIVFDKLAALRGLSVLEHLLLNSRSRFVPSIQLGRGCLKDVCANAIVRGAQILCRESCSMDELEARGPSPRSPSDSRRVPRSERLSRHGEELRPWCHRFKCLFKRTVSQATVLTCTA